MEKHHFRLQPKLTRNLSLLSVLFLLGCGGMPSQQIEGLEGAFFGEAVSVTRNEILIGAPGGIGDGISLEGLIYTFVPSSKGWIPNKILESGRLKKQDHYDYFGKSVSLSGTTALVGAWGTDVKALSSGSAYVFERDSSKWSQATLLIPPGNEAWNSFGMSVAIKEGVAVIGAPGADRRKKPTFSGWTGNVYVWSKENTKWEYQVKLSPELPNRDKSSNQPIPIKDIVYGFGHEVAVGKDIIVVSAHQGTATPGQVFVFRKHNNTWKQEARLEVEHDYFARSVAVSDETIAVSAKNTIFIYSLVDDEWLLQSRVSPRVRGEAGFLYGGSLSLDGNIMVAGATRYEERKGAAFVFERVGTEWKQTAMLTANDTKSDRLFRGAIGDLFGRSVSIHEDIIVIGANFHDSAGPNNGAAYVFVKKGSKWVQLTKLIAPIIP